MYKLTFLRVYNFILHPLEEWDNVANTPSDVKTSFKKIVLPMIFISVILCAIVSFLLFDLKSAIYVPIRWGLSFACCFYPSVYITKEYLRGKAGNNEFTVQLTSHCYSIYAFCFTLAQAFDNIFPGQIIFILAFFFLYPLIKIVRTKNLVSDDASTGFIAIISLTTILFPAIAGQIFKKVILFFF